MTIKTWSGITLGLLLLLSGQLFGQEASDLEARGDKKITKPSSGTSVYELKDGQLEEGARPTPSAPVTPQTSGTPTTPGGSEVYELKNGQFEKVAQPDPTTPEGLLWLARRALAQGDASEAYDVTDQWIDDYPKHLKRHEAHILRAEALFDMKYYYRSLFDYEVVLRFYPESAAFHQALARELEIAKLFIGGTNRRLWVMRLISAEDVGEELLIRIQERSPGSAMAEKAAIELANYYFRDKKWALALTAYDLFLQNYPKSRWRQLAMRRQVDSSMARFTDPHFDTTGLIEARERLNDYQAAFPATARQLQPEQKRTMIDESLAERFMVSARWYDRVGRRVSAMVMYQRVIKDYPNTKAAAAAMKRLIELDPTAVPTTQPPAADVPTTTKD